MKSCPNCHCQVNDEAAFCPVCGTTLDNIPILSTAKREPEHSIPAYIPPEPTVDPADHTAEFDPEDIKEQKLVSMVIYLLDFVGIIIALLMSKESPYVRFHTRQALKFTVVEVLLTLVTALLCWTIIVPVLGAAAMVALLVLKFVSFTQVCAGRAVEPVLIRSIGFLK